MRIVVPMAGMGKRMRPHTLTIPKPLIPVGGKAIVHRLVEDIAQMFTEPIEEIAFVVGRFGKETEDRLIRIAENLGAKGSIYYQDEALGTAHAILCAEPSLSGKTIVAFADTLFRADFSMDEDKDGVLWVKQIDDPSQFGVVKLDDSGNIIDYVEKPAEFVSDLAMIGIYYFKDGEELKQELQYLIDNDVIKGGEYQLPDALRNMTNKGRNFVPGKVDEWLDCGNKNATVYSNQRVLEFDRDKLSPGPEVELDNAQIIEPCFIAGGVKISNSTVGPHVSLGENSVVSNSTVSNTIVQSNTTIENSNIKDSMIGSHCHVEANTTDASLGDYSTFRP